VRPLNRPLHVFLCVSIVAAIQLPLAAAVVVSEDVPVPGGTESVARALGLDITPDRARFAGEIMRFAYNIPEPKNPRVEEWRSLPIDLGRFFSTANVPGPCPASSGSSLCGGAR